MYVYFILKYFLYYTASVFGIKYFLYKSFKTMIIEFHVITPLIYLIYFICIKIFFYMQSNSLIHGFKIRIQIDWKFLIYFTPFLFAGVNEAVRMEGCQQLSSSILTASFTLYLSRFRVVTSIKLQTWFFSTFPADKKVEFER